MSGALRSSSSNTLRAPHSVCSCIASHTRRRFCPVAGMACWPRPPAAFLAVLGPHKPLCSACLALVCDAHADTGTVQGVLSEADGC
eukprot:scaffold180881_cov20-Tisochrysis_lutea.AAC.1